MIYKDKLIVYGTVIRKSGTIEDIYFVYNCGDCAAVGVAKEGGDGLIYINEPYNSNWRKTPRATYTERGYKS